MKWFRKLRWELLDEIHKKRRDQVLRIARQRLLDADCLDIQFRLTDDPQKVLLSGGTSFSGTIGMEVEHLAALMGAEL